MVCELYVNKKPNNKHILSDRKSDIEPIGFAIESFREEGNFSIAEE